MRILVLTNRFPRPASPTVATYNLIQALAMSKHHDVRAIVPVPWTEEVRDIVTRRKMPVRDHTRFGGLRVYHPTLFFAPSVMLHRYGEQYLLSVRPLVRRVAREMRADAIFCCWTHPDAWAAVRLGDELGVPVLTKVIGSDVLVLGKDPKRRPLVIEALKRSAGVIAVGENLANKTIELGIDAAKVSVVGEGVDKSVFHPGDREEARRKLGIPQGEKTILYVGNVLVSKGVRDLIEACAILKREGRTFHCRIVGHGADRPAMEALVLERALSADVTFHGASAQEALGDWYRACDFSTLPSHSEGIPNVLREAELCGRPYVATRVGGVPEIAKPDVSRLVDAKDVTALAAAFGAFLDHTPVVDPVKANARHLDPDASAKLVIDRLEAILRS
jgi:glycosyltransferase involved in cell wall biosynthesis